MCECTKKLNEIEHNIYIFSQQTFIDMNTAIQIDIKLYNFSKILVRIVLYVIMLKNDNIFCQLFAALKRV